MTEQELKKKIVDVINVADISVVLRRNDIIILADALIAAGLKFDVNYSFTAAFNSVQAERERDLERRLTAAEHRAEVAESALRYACWDLTKYYGAKVRQEWGDLKAAQYKNKAEKELAEERKDDNK